MQSKQQATEHRSSKRKTRKQSIFVVLLSGLRFLNLLLSLLDKLTKLWAKIGSFF